MAQHTEPDKPIFENYIDENKDFMQNPTDFSDPIQEEKRRKQIKTLFTALTVILLIAVLSVGTYYLLHKNTNTEPTTTTTSATPHTTNPLQNQYKGAAENTSGEVSVNIGKPTEAFTNNGSHIQINGAHLQAPEITCNTNTMNDFCMVALHRDKDKEFDLYYLRDAVKSRLLENAEEYTPVKINGSAASATMKLNIGNTERPALVAVNNDSSGWLIVVKKGSTNQFLQNITLS